MWPSIQKPWLRAQRRRKIKVDAFQYRRHKSELRTSFSEAKEKEVSDLRLRKKASIAAVRDLLEALENGKVEDGGMSGFAGGFWDLLIEEKEEG